MTISDRQKLAIISKKINQLESLYDQRHKEFGLVGSQNDILILLRFTLSLERQIRQLRADFDAKVVA